MPSSRSATTTLLLLASVTLVGLTLAAHASGTVGETAPAFSLKGVDGKTYSLADFKGKAVVLEWVNPNCPFSDRHAREHTMSDLHKKYGQVAWLGVNSTAAGHRDFLKPADYQAYNTKNGIVYPILYDETGKVGHAYGAKTTPHMFIVDPQGKIAYNGAIDDDPMGNKGKAERVNYVDGGLGAELAGKKLDPAATKPYGCSVKY